MKLIELQKKLSEGPTILPSEENFRIMEELSSKPLEDIENNIVVFFNILELLEYSVQESFDWVNPDKEPIDFVNFLEKINYHFKNSTEITHYIDFFRWSKWGQIS